MASYIIEDSQGRPFDLFGNTKASAGGAEGAPVARDPRAKAPDEVVDDPVSGLVKVKNVSLSRATFVKFKPLSVDFLEISKDYLDIEFF